jgi:energy-converting hydrogenase Eha subunit A
MIIKPETKLGKWSVGLNILFLIGIVFAVFSTSVLGILDMDIGHWWDIEVAIIFPASIIAFILGIIAIKKKDHSVLVYSSVVIGLLTILFILLHSLFISD